jgi:hypothetical protein
MKWLISPGKRLWEHPFYFNLHTGICLDKEDVNHGWENFNSRNTLCYPIDSLDIEIFQGGNYICTVDIFDNCWAASTSVHCNPTSNRTDYDGHPASTRATSPPPTATAVSPTDTPIAVPPTGTRALPVRTLLPTSAKEPASMRKPIESRGEILSIWKKRMPSYSGVDYTYLVLYRDGSIEFMTRILPLECSLAVTDEFWFEEGKVKVSYKSYIY